MRRPLLVVAVVLAALASLAVAALALAAGTPLRGKVGPGFTISLVDSSGAAVSHLDPGAYDLTVDDLSDAHNFHLQGPGVDVATEVAGQGTKTFALALVDGTYAYVCDAHPQTMKGSFTVGTPPPPPPPKPSPSPSLPKLTLTVTDRTITLRTTAGNVPRSVKAGQYAVTVADRSRRQNAHIVGRGVNRKTGITFVGTVTWKLVFQAGGLTYRSDAKEPKLKAGRVVVA